MLANAILLAAVSAAVPDRIRSGPEPELRQIEAAIDAFVSSYNAGDIDALMEVYDADFVDISLGTETIAGNTAIESTRLRLQETFARYQGHLKVQTQEIRVEGNMAYDRGILVVTLTPRDGGERITIRRRFLEIWVKKKEGFWRVARAMDNN